jgi:hypothetical protein
MTRPSPPIKIHRLAAVAVAALVAVVGASAHDLLPVGDPASTLGKRRGPSAFKIAGKLPRPLVPGTSQSLNLRLTNRRRFGLRITKLTVRVTVDARHVAAGCRRAPNFKVTPLARAAYPIRLRPRVTRTLRAVGIRRLPRVAMRNLATNQDACKGARLTFRYAGRARRWRGGRAR